MVYNRSMLCKISYSTESILGEEHFILNFFKLLISLDFYASIMISYGGNILFTVWIVFIVIA